MGTVKLPFYARLALTLLAVVLIVFIMMQGANVFIPLTFALLMSILLFPLNRFFRNKLHMGKALSALLSVIILVSGLVGFFYFLTIQIVNFSHDFPELQKKFHDIFQNFQHWLSSEYHINSKQQMDYLNKSGSGIMSTAAHSVGNAFLSFAGILLWLVFIFIYTFFMLFHRQLLMKFVTHLFSVQHREKVREVISETKGMIQSYVSGLLLEMLILSVVNCTVFLIMGIQYALLLGVLAAVLNVIPYLGIYSAAAFAMLVTFANSGGSQALEVGAVLIVVHLLDSNILMPRVVGARVKMNPFITIIAVVVGEFVWGIPGMFLFVPLVGIMKLICDRVEGMEAWGILIGVEDKEVPKRKVNLSVPKPGTQQVSD